MANEIEGMRVAILIADGFEQVEMTEPRKALQQAGAQADIVSPAKEQVKAWNYTDWGEKFRVDVHLDEASASDYDALMLPGGVLNPDQLRIMPRAVEFVRQFFDAGKPIAAICHAPWTLINAEVVKGRKITSWPSVRIDLINAGAKWVDEQVVRDGKMVTSRKPGDLPAFNPAMIELFAEARQPSRRTASSEARR
jgi:protease I